MSLVYNLQCVDTSNSSGDFVLETNINTATYPFNRCRIYSSDGKRCSLTAALNYSKKIIMSTWIHSHTVVAPYSPVGYLAGNGKCCYTDTFLHIIRLNKPSGLQTKILLFKVTNLINSKAQAMCVLCFLKLGTGMYVYIKSMFYC